METTTTTMTTMTMTMFPVEVKREGSLLASSWVDVEVEEATAKLNQA